MSVDRELDARGLLCPLPILKTKKTLSEMAPGQLLQVVCTDPDSVADFATFCRNTGHVMVDNRQADAEFTFLLKKKG